MRISSLLVVWLCAVVSVCETGDAVRRSSSSPAAVNSFSSDGFNPSPGGHDFFRLPASDRADRDLQPRDSARDGDVTCYTIENFRVKRETPGSDVTEPAGHSTCLPASKYSVKKVEEPGKARLH
jgi:hypothetical protein